MSWELASCGLCFLSVVDVVDVIVGINGAFGRGRWFQEPVAVPL